MAQNLVINSVQYSNVPEIDVPKVGGGSAKFFDTTSADATSGNILTGKKAYGANGEITGSMADNGDVSGEIETKAGTVTIPSGHTSGGTVGIKSSAVSDCISANILTGKSILGVSGSLSMVSVSQDSSTKVLSIS